MATLASLNIALTADSARLKSDLNKAKGHSKKFAADQKKQFAAVASSLKVVGAAAAVVGIAIARSIGVAAEAAKELKIMADLTGESTSRLQQIEPALVRAGISLEKYADIVKDVNDKTHDFLQTGGGPMKDFFEQIAPKVGITQKAFQGLSGAQGLQLYVNSLEKAGLSQEQMTFYMEALASDSTMLLPLLRDNAAGMDEFGLSVNSVLRADTITGLTALSTNFEILRTSITNIVANKLSGWITAVAGYMDILNSKMAGNYEVTADFGEALDNVTLAMGDEIDQANKLFTLLGTGMTVTQSAAIATLSNAKAHLASAEAKFEEAEAEKALQMILLQRDYQLEKDALKTIREGTDAYEEREQAIATILRRMNELNGYTKGSKEELAKAAAEVVRIQTAIDASVDGMVVFDGELVTANSLSERLANNFGAMGMPAIITDAQTLMEKLGISLELAKAIAKIGGSSGASGPDAAIQQTRDAYNMNDLINKGIASVTNYPSSGGGGSGGGGSSGVDASEAMRAATQAILDEAAEADGAGWSSIAEDFSSTLKSELSSALKSGDWSGVGDALMNQLTSSIIDKMVGGAVDFGMSLLGFADGGIVPSTPNSKSYADSVPAMLQPGELVVPVDQVGNFLNGGGSGGGQTFNINVTGDVSRLTRSEIVKMMPEIAAGTNMLNKENGRR